MAKTVGAIPISHVDHMTPDKLGKAGLIEEVTLGDDSKIVKVTGVNPDVRTMSIFVRGTNSLVVEEADRSIHDALCVVRSLVKRKGMLVGGGAPEIEVSQGLLEYSRTLRGASQMVVKAYAQALEVIPETLAGLFIRKRRPQHH